MPLSILSDGQIKGLLEDLTVEELESFKDALSSALHEYSVGTQSRTPEDDNHLERQVVFTPSTGTKSLFMPSHGPPGLGVKVITLSSPEATKNADDGDAPELPVVRPTGAISLFSARGDPVAVLHASHITAFRTALASTCLVQRRDQVKVLTVFGTGLQAYYHVRLALKSRGPTVKQVNIINHRYNDGCRDLLKRFWTIPAETKRREGWADCQFAMLTPGYVEYERLLKEQIRAADVIFCCTPSTRELFPAGFLTNPEGRRKGRLLVAIGSYTPQMAEIPLDVLRQTTKRHKGHGPHFHKHAAEGGVVIVDTIDGALKEAGELIAAGLHPDQLVELGELVMLQRCSLPDESDGDSEVGSRGDTPLGSPLAQEFDGMSLTPGTSAMSTVFGSSTSRASSRSRGSSPSRSGAASPPASEKSRSGYRGFFSHKRSSSHNSVKSETKAKTKDDHLALWLQRGNVIYKSVGMGLMDLAVGMHLVRFAREKNVGSHVEDF
uniref:Ornithine cyclodeaminase/mu-crystallin family protein n=1 Tax=Pyricularia oryzae (strain P131) TaxID=1143193 RepID=L7IU76_PYRO1